MAKTEKLRASLWKTATLNWRRPGINCTKNTSEGGGESESDGAGIGGGGGFLDFFSGWSSTPSSELLLLLSLSLPFLLFSFFLFSSSSFSLSRSRRSSSASSLFRRSSSSRLRSSSLFFHSLMQSVSLSLWKHKAVFMYATRRCTLTQGFACNSCTQLNSSEQHADLSLSEDDEGARFTGAGFGFRAWGFGAGFSGRKKVKY